MKTIEFLGYLNSLDIKLWLEEDKLRYQAPKGSITPEIKQEIGTRKPDLIALLAGAKVTANSLELVIPPADRIEVLGPAEAPLAVIRGRHRWRLLIKAPRDLDLQAYLRVWLASLPKLPNDLRLVVDIDPYSFL